jgi:hypothetical protein
MALRSPLERAVFMKMIQYFISLKVVDMINKYDNYPKLRKTYIFIYHIIVYAYCFLKI